jgi:RNA polymerase sigma factor (sigma-70 family)
MKAMQNLGSLSKASSFKSWLFSIAHNTAVTRAERGGRSVPLPAPVHEEAFGTFDVPDPSRLDNPEIVAEDHELASLVWEAATALNPRDYALLDMHVRQGLESAEIAEVMGVSKGNAYTMVSRMKQAAGNVFSSYIVARRGSRDCDELQRVIAQFSFPPYTEDIRRAVDTHVDACEVCQRTRRGLVAPMEIFSSFAVVPAPYALKADLWRDVSGAWPYQTAGAGTGGGGNGGALVAASAAGAGAGALAAGAGGPPDMPVSPVYGGGEEPSNRYVLFAVAALGMLLFAFIIAAAVVLAGNMGDDDGGAAGGDDETPEATGTVEGEPGDGSPTPPVIVETATQGPTDTPSPTGTVTETPTISPDTPTPPPVPTDTPEPEPDPPTNTPVPEPTRPGLPPIPTRPPGGN